MKTVQLTRTALVWLLLTVVMVLLPHLGHLPLWVPGLVGAGLVWRLMAFLGRWSFPPWWIKAAFVVVAAVGVLVSYRSGGGISATVTLLIVAFGLKLVEMYQRRDALVVIYVAYIVAATAFLFSQSILMAGYVSLTLVVATCALMAAYMNRPVTSGQLFRRTLLMYLPAIPLMIVLFIGVPRLGPLWEVGLDRSIAKTGLSDSMSPGDITRLTRSAEPAFRVTFDGAPPAQKDLYWRAIVLSDFDGRRWSAQQGVGPATLPSFSSASPRLNYEILLEPTQRKYVPVLEQISVRPQRLLLSADMTVQSPRPLVSRTQFRMEAALQGIPDQGLTIFDLEQMLYLPLGNEKTRERAQQWWRESGEFNAYLDKIRGFYHQQFHYSLSPPPLGRDSIDQFLEETQTGFCEHFSSATAFMLRAVGIPARIVTGYQGGEWNPYERYLLVRQYDAHAWVEAWVEGQGWIRIDPTAWVAPERVERTADETFASDQAFLSDSPLLAWGIKGNSVLAQLRLRMEAFNYGWHRWVLNYHEHQRGFLSGLLGAVSFLKLALFLLIPFSVVVGLTMLLMLRQRRRRDLDPIDQQVVRLSQKLAPQGLARAPGETVTAYCQRLADVRPEHLELLSALAAAYEQLRYAGERDPKALRQLIHLVDQSLRQF